MYTGSSNALGIVFNNTGTTTTETTVDGVLRELLLNGNGGIPSAYNRIELTITSNNQTLFNLGVSVTNYGTTQLFINGHKAKYALDYNFTSDTVLEYIPNSFSLELTDNIELYYI